MTSEFVERVLKERSIDTGKYHYGVTIKNGRQEIRRMPSDDYNAAFSNDKWVSVWKQSNKTPKLKVYDNRKCMKCRRIVFNIYKVGSVLGLPICELEDVRPYKHDGKGYLCVDCYNKIYPNKKAI